MIEAFAYARPEIPEGLMHEMFDVLSLIHI